MMKVENRIQEDWEIDGRHNSGLHKPTGIRLRAVDWSGNKIIAVSFSYSKELQLRVTNKLLRQLKEELEFLLKDLPLITFQDFLEDYNIPPEKWEEGQRLYKEFGEIYDGRNLKLNPIVLLWLIQTSRAGR